jgi:hypothetical protein
MLKNRQTNFTTELHGESHLGVWYWVLSIVREESCPSSSFLLFTSSVSPW